MPDANGGRSCRRRLLRGVGLAAVFAVGGLTASPGVSPAKAADTLRGTDIEIPAPLPAPIRGEGEPLPEAPTEGGGGGSSPTVPLGAPEGGNAPAGSTVAPSSPSPGASSTSDAGTTRTTSRTRPRARSTSAPANDGAVPAVNVPFAPSPDDGHATVERLREASVPAARQFSLPLALGALVLAFLAVQGRIDKRDAKLMAAPITVADDLLPFA